MMLNKMMRDILRSMRRDFYKFISNWYFESENEDTRQDFEETYKANAKMSIPTYDEMKKEIFGMISEAGFHFAQVSPRKANCVVRIYRKEMEIDGTQGGLCGAVCFVKNMLGKWTTIDNDGRVVEMTHGKYYSVPYWTSLITKYEKPVKANYYDVYLKVRRNI